MTADSLRIEEIVNSIVADHADVLFLDACAILDIIRALKRAALTDLKSACDIIGISNAKDRRVQVVLASVIKQECQDHFDDALAELDSFLTRLSDDLQTFNEACTILGLQVGRIPAVNGAMKKQIIKIANQFLQNSVSIKEEDRFHAAASRRVVKCVPPASKGKQELKDCIIIEEYLEVCKNVRAKAGDSTLLFLTSNSKDFCIAETKQIKQELASEFSQFGLEYCYSWQHVFSKLSQ